MHLWWKRIGKGTIAVVVLAQLIPVEKTNPAFDPAKTLWSASGAPPEITASFQRSCQYCHSNLTKWRWYSHVAPVSWLITNDVNSGRRHFNVDAWDSYDTARKESKLTKICEELKSGDMPDSNYTLMHREAKFTDQDRNAMCTWAESTRQSILRGEAATPAGVH